MVQMTIFIFWDLELIMLNRKYHEQVKRKITMIVDGIDPEYVYREKRREGYKVYNACYYNVFDLKAKLE